MTRRDDRADSEWSRYALRLASTLQAARIEAGLSQEQVAYRAGLSRYTYQKYERGESRPGMSANPTLRSVFAIAQALDLALEELLPSPRPDLRIR